jgi:hypothetical protein
MYTSEQLFYRWYVEPLEAVKSLPEAKGGFVALAVSCFLYERYAIAVIKSFGAKATKENKIKQLATDFNVDEKIAGYFWDVIRNGLLHAGMPKQKQNDDKLLPRWAFRQNFLHPIELLDYEGELILKVQPFLFADRVLELWQENLELLKDNDSFPWANIGPLPF